MRHLLFMVVVVLVFSLPAVAAPSFFGGYSGNILSPDAIVVPAGVWQASYHVFSDGDENVFGLMYGLTENLEVGAGFFNNGDSETSLNAKMRLMPETATRPAVVVGVADLGGDVLDDDPSFYVLVSKNITPVASEIAGEPSKPLQLTIGVGSGGFDGFFAGFDWTLQERLSLMAEFVDFGNDSEFNAGVRFALANNFRLDAGLIDMDDFAFGASYTSQF